MVPMTYRSLVRGVILILGMAWSGVATAGDTPHDGTWWGNLGQEQQLVYLEGFALCSIHDAGDSRLTHGGFHALVPKISAYYAGAPSRKRSLVSKILLDLGPGEPFLLEPSGAEHYSEKYGFYDGLFWQQAGLEVRLGIVTGYLDCWRQFRPTGATYSREAGWYVEQISKWYGLDRSESGTARPDRISKKVPRAIQLFKD
jgi:hypothetical protein